MTDSNEPTGVVNADAENQSPLMRGLYMILFAIAFEISEIILFFTAILQFFWLLFTRHPNELLKRFGLSLSQWLAATAQFLTCNTEEKPFPFAPWPEPDRS